MFFAELIRKDRSHIKTEIPLNDKNPELQKRPPRQPKTHQSNSNYFHLYVNALWNAMVVYTILLMVILVLYTNGWFFQYISNEGKVFHFVILILQKN